MKRIINERILREAIKHAIREALNGQFSMDEFKRYFDMDISMARKHSAYRDKINHGMGNTFRYCYQLLGEPLNSGSSRCVFQIDDTRVLKFAMNPKGIAQNKEEFMVYKNSPMKELMPIVFNDSDLSNFGYLVTEYVLPAEEEDFQKTLGISFGQLYNIIQIVYNAKKRPTNYNLRDLTEIEEKYQSNKQLSKLIVYFKEMCEYGIELGDWQRIVNWGMAMRNGQPTMVTLDNGFSSEVNSNYYGGNGDRKTDTVGQMLKTSEPTKERRRREEEERKRREQEEEAKRQQAREEGMKKVKVLEQNLPQGSVAKAFNNWLSKSQVPMENAYEMFSKRSLFNPSDDWNQLYGNFIKAYGDGVDPFSIPIPYYIQQEVTNMIETWAKQNGKINSGETRRWGNPFRGGF